MRGIESASGMRSQSWKIVVVREQQRQVKSLAYCAKSDFVRAIARTKTRRNASGDYSGMVLSPAYRSHYHSHTATFLVVVRAVGPGYARRRLRNLTLRSPRTTVPSSEPHLPLTTLFAVA